MEILIGKTHRNFHCTPNQWVSIIATIEYDVHIRIKCIQNIIMVAINALTLYITALASEFSCWGAPGGMFGVRGGGEGGGGGKI